MERGTLPSVFENEEHDESQNCSHCHKHQTLDAIFIYIPWYSYIFLQSPFHSLPAACLPYSLSAATEQQCVNNEAKCPLCIPGLWIEQTCAWRVHQRTIDNPWKQHCRLLVCNSYSRQLSDVWLPGNLCPSTFNADTARSCFQDCKLCLPVISSYCIV